MNRKTNLQRLLNETFDLVIIGGGASGAGCALDAATRGLKVALIDRDDFAAATSSRSTKLIHGGVRYLEQAFKNFDFAQLRQVRHGLEERHIVLQNAPHLAHPLGLITPVFSWFEGLYFTIGLTLYGWFARHDSLPKAQWLSKKETLVRMPTLTSRLHSSVLYYDGQLDDARYCLALVQTASEAGAVVINHTEAIGFERNDSGKLTAVIVRDRLTNQELTVRASLFVNCTGPYADAIRRLANTTVVNRIRPSKGVHITLPFEILQSKDALLIPKTPDGRVIFSIPFESKVIVGTTDNDYQHLEEEPLLQAQEAQFLLDTLASYLAKKPTPDDVQAGFGGIRPLIATDPNAKTTKGLVRDHEVEHDSVSNLVSLLGGKWTTYRLMAEDTINKACELLGRSELTCQTASHRLVGAENYSPTHWKSLADTYTLTESTARHLNQTYGGRAEQVIAISREKKEYADYIIEGYPYLQSEVIYQARHEMACSPRDVLARRLRLELLDWRATHNATPIVAELLATELGWSVVETQLTTEQYQHQLAEFESAVNISSVHSTSAARK